MDMTDTTVLNKDIQSLSITDSDVKSVSASPLLTNKLDESMKDKINDEIITDTQKEAENDKANLREEHLKKLRSWINHRMTIEMTDGRVLIGTFLCTDRDANVILGSCGEYLSPQVFENKEENGAQEARLLGLVMVPGQHIVNILHEEPNIS